MLWWTLRQLKSNDPETRRRAVEKLCNSGDERVIEPLLMSLTDRDRWVRIATIQALGRIKDQRALETLQTLLRSEPFIIRKEAAKALISLGWQPIDSSDRALFAIIKQDWKEAVTLSSESVDLLLLALNDDDQGERLQSIEVMRNFRDIRVIETLQLLSSNRDNDQRERLKAIEVMGNFEDVHSIETLRSLFSNKDEAVNRQVQDALMRIVSNANSVESLLTILTAQIWWKGEEPIRSEIIDRLAYMGDTHAVEPLLKILGLGNNDTYYIRFRAKAARALGQLGDARAAPALAYCGSSVYGDGYGGPFYDIPELRHAAKEALKKLGLTAVEPLLNELRTGSIIMKKAAAEGLELLGWKAKNSAERAYTAVANQDWQSVAALGAAAVPSLIATTDDYVADKAVSILEQLLRQNAPDIQLDDLHELTRLQAVEWRVVYDNDGFGDIVKKSPDCSELHQLARQELNRRRLEV